MVVHAEISPLTTVGAVHLTVSDIGRSVEYHRRIVGLEVLERSSGHASLGCGGRELLVLAAHRGRRRSTLRELRRDAWSLAALPTPNTQDVDPQRRRTAWLTFVAGYGATCRVVR